MHRILAVATLGSGSSDEARILELLREFQPGKLPFDRRRKLASFLQLLRELRARKPDLVCLEGTGIAGGAAVILARALFGVPYVLSSGDAVGPFVAAQAPWAAPAFSLYERLLCRLSSGFVGWSPYLAGRALTLGARRAMTAPGWSPFEPSPAEREAARREIRARLGIPEGALVIGIAGSLAWNPRYGYAYGLELIRALKELRDPRVHALIIGDGPGLEHLRREAGAELEKTLHLPGRVPREEVWRWLSALDLGSLPQTIDGVGSFRYTTKLPEYLACGVPIVTGQLPLAYDLATGEASWLWRLAGERPWEERYVRNLAGLLGKMELAELAARKGAALQASTQFQREPQIARATAFIKDLLAE